MVVVMVMVRRATVAEAKGGDSKVVRLRLMGEHCERVKVKGEETEG